MYLNEYDTVKSPRSTCSFKISNDESAGVQNLADLCELEA